MPAFPLTLAFGLLLVGAEARVRTRGFFSAYTSTLAARECTCNCCIREPRRPGEIFGEVQYKCSMPPANDKRLLQNGCEDTCTVVNDAIFKRSSTLETNRYCFYHCQPVAGGSHTPLSAALASQSTAALQNGGSLVDAECVSVRPAMMHKAISGDMNGRDSGARLEHLKPKLSLRTVSD
mmetsp:Transcript_123559/g.245936  ORF Transcript_123559/g.245936 Transcript_123559/m.245936 type:complete len:179 (+) Transcript_123559:95-631(+)